MDRVSCATEKSCEGFRRSADRQRDPTQDNRCCLYRSRWISDATVRTPTPCARRHSDSRLAELPEEEGESIAGQSSNEATKKIKGPEGSEVTIGVRDGTSGKLRKLTITRAEVSLPNVSSSVKTVNGNQDDNDAGQSGAAYLFGLSQ